MPLSFHRRISLRAGLRRKVEVVVVSSFSRLCIPASISASISIMPTTAARNTLSAQVDSLLRTCHLFPKTEHDDAGAVSLGT